MTDTERAADGLRFGCPGCGSGLRYDIGLGKMHCDNCGTTCEIGEIGDPSLGAADGLMDAAEYRCPQCGAAVHTSQTAVTSFCSYCGADVILTQKLTRTRRPDQLVPFSVTREKCEEIYRRRVRESRYAPEDFGAQETISHFRPVYIPFWQYRGQGFGQTQGTAVHHHSDRRYDYTDKYGYDVAGSVSVDNVIYDASVSFEDETAQELRFSTDRTQPFHPAYLCGFYAEAPDTEPGLYDQQVKQFASKAWKDEFRRKCELSSPEVKFLEDGAFTTGASLTLMPVWLLAHRSGKRVVYTAINGDTGDIVCDTPVSNKRFATLAVTLSAVAVVLLTLLSFAVILRPRLLAALCGLAAAVGQWVIASVSKDIRIRRDREDDLTWQTVQNNGKKPKKVKMRSRVPGCGWFIPVLGTAAIVGVGAFMSWQNSYNFNQFVGKLISEHAWLPPVTLVCALGFFLISGYKKQDTLDDLLFLLRLAAVGLSLAAMFLTSTDTSFYLCSILMMGLTAFSLTRLNKAHNEFVSRPVPFFGKEGSQT